jgi:hypothetical protein
MESKEPECTLPSEMSMAVASFGKGGQTISPVSHITPTGSPEDTERIRGLAEAMACTDLDRQRPNRLSSEPPSPHVAIPACEPLLDPDISRFVLFPIKRPEVRLHNVRVFRLLKAVPDVDRL